jgi:hypothetical protein
MGQYPKKKGPAGPGKFMKMDENSKLSCGCNAPERLQN